MAATCSPSAARMAALRSKRKAQHQCFRCGCPLSESETRRDCEACRTRHALTLSRRYYRLARAHACITCGIAHMTRYVRCQACHEHNKQAMATARHVADSLIKRTAWPAEEEET